MYKRYFHEHNELFNTEVEILKLKPRRNSVKYTLLACLQKSSSDKNKTHKIVRTIPLDTL